MRRGELLNLTWADVDFEEQAIHVAPKDDTATTWPWYIKDAERRKLPLTEELTHMLVLEQEQQPEGHPYVLVPTKRYEHIQKRRLHGAWTTEHGKCPINNFTDRFETIRQRAHIQSGTFHDLRRTCLTRWFENGLSEYDVMRLAGHSDFNTTRRFYLAVRRDLLDRARSASAAAMGTGFGTRLARAPICGVPRKKTDKLSA